MGILQGLVTFASGAAYEYGCVFWVHCAEAGKPAKAAVWSMLLATVTLVGVGESLRDLRYAPLYVLGYGAGTFAAVRQRVTRAR